MQAATGYRLVKLANGVHSVYSLAFGEKMHPGLGPAAEADALHVRQLKLCERVARYPGEFVIWDVGLGAAANALAVLRATRGLACRLRLVSFDYTAEPLEFALAHQQALGYFNAYTGAARALLERGEAEIEEGARIAKWQLRLVDFTALMAEASAQTLPEPHAILYDPFSPATNPAMWTLSLFTNLFHLLDPQQPCALTTYSRSTMVRVALLLAGFFVGRGHAAGAKEETTCAANTLALLDVPLDRHWLQRARRSDSAEPLHEPVYCQAPLTAGTWAGLQQHPQFGTTN